MSAADTADQAIAPVELVPNPDFVFPAQSLPEQTGSSTYHGPRRAASLHLHSSTPQRVTSLERRSASTLPTFTFNASDTSGRMDGSGDLNLPEPPASVGSKGTGHRRGASEFVGGSSKYGPPGLVNTSPAQGLDTNTQTQNLASFGSPVRKRGHAHRRSAAVSAHDLQTILQPRDANVGSSQNEETTPVELSGSPADAEKQHSINPSPHSFPIPRPRVGFSTNVEIIPRPLSTISSEAESIASIPCPSSSATASSPLRPTNFSPSAKRKSRSARSSLSEVESVSNPRSSLEARVPLEREGYLLKTDLERPMTDSSATSRLASNFRDFSFPPRKRPTNLDRRSSEPSLSLASLQKPRRSSVSLREPLDVTRAKRNDSAVKAGRILRKPSASRVKAWASSVINRKEKKGTRSTADENSECTIETPTSASGMTPASEPDLEELFSHDPFSEPDDGSSRGPAFSAKDMENLRDFQPTYDGPSTDMDPVIDLDAALGPNRTPSRDGKSPGFGARRQLHSSRGNRDFNSPGNIYHRRAESAPILIPFEYGKSSSPMHSPMADVFEEEEEDEANKADSKANDTPTPPFAFPASQSQASDDLSRESIDTQDEGLGIHEGNLLQPPTPTGPSMHSDLPVLHDTIMEEVGPLEIVEAHEEPRASTLTKSSDSSDTPTVLADPVFSLAPPQAAFMTPSTYNGSTFSTPDMTRRQGSFETSRVGTSASSATDCRTLSSFASERPDTRISVDDVPSLTSSRSTMISGMHPPRRGDASDKASSVRSRQLHDDQHQQEQRRRKRASIQSLTKLMTGPFGESRNRLNLEQGNASTPDLLSGKNPGRKREHRLSKLMFWRSKGSRVSTASGL